MVIKSCRHKKGGPLFGYIYGSEHALGAQMRQFTSATRSPGNHRHALRHHASSLFVHHPPSELFTSSTNRSGTPD